MAASQRNNILHNYANNTYNLQLWAITKEAFNKVADGIQIGQEQAIEENGEILISNGGFSQSDKRNEFFTDIDMAIDNLDIETIVGNKGKMARGTDAITLKFDIIEPYTVTLLDRLIRVAQTKAPGQDFKGLIYCLKIQFFGYNDDGTIATIPATKWFPITLLNMKFNITQRGALYNVQAIPAHQLVMTQINNTIPFHVELQGQTIGELFNGSTLQTINVGGAANSRTDTAAPPNGGSTSVVRSIVKALNDNEQFKVAQKSQKYPNTYKFEFDPDLSAAKIVDPANMPNNAFVFAPIQGADGQTARYQAQAGTLKIDNVNGAFRTQAGTSITDFIQSIFIVTDFMRNQVTSPGDPSKPFIGIKIIPKMKVIKYDPITKNYQREITYSVVKFEYTGEDHESMPQKPPADADVVKNYEYIFTGNNRDVRNISLNYQMAFFETRVTSKTSVSQNANDGINDNTTTDAASTTESSDNGQPRLGQAGRNPVSLLAHRTNSGGIEADDKSLTVSEMMSKLFDNIADTISLDIEIVGDPDWVQQDNVLYSTELPKDQKIASNGVINFQNNITHFQFTFKSPTTDYDPITGLMDVSNSSTAIFSGKYHVITVTSSFRKGKFTQKLTNNRIRIQNASQLPPPPAPPAGDGRPVAAPTTPAAPPAPPPATSASVPLTPQQQEETARNLGATGVNDFGQAFDGGLGLSG